MSNPEKYFINQLRAHHCHLPPSDDIEFVRNVKKIKNCFLISEKNLQSYLKAKSLAAIYYEKRRQIRTTQLLVIHPYSEFRKGWHLWMCFVLLMAVIIFPFSSAFHGPFYAKSLKVDEHKTWHISFYSVLLTVFLIRIFCLIDIVVQFTMGYVSKSTDEMVINPARIARRYLGTYFFFDLISSIPLDFIMVVVKGTLAYSQLSTIEHGFFSLLPLFKLIRVRTLYIYFHTIWGYFSSSYSVYKMVAGTFFYFLLIHWAACLNTLIPHIIFYDTLYNCTTRPCSSSWLRTEDVLTKDVFIQYLAALDRSVNCFTGVGYKVFLMTNIEDKYLAIVIGILGKVYWMLLLVVFLQMLVTIRSGRSRYLDMMDQVNQYINQKRFPPALKKKIQTYYLYMFQKEFIDEKSILRLLSENLQQELVLRMHQSLIEKIYMFSGLSQTFVYSVVSRLKPEIYLTNDVIYKAGDVASSMYFISFGTVAVYSESGRELGHLEDGEYFGEVSLIFSLRRLSTVIAIEPTETYRLGIKDFFDVIKDHPVVYPKMEKIAMERYKKCHDSLLNKKVESEIKTSTIKETEEEDDDEDDFDDDDAEDDYPRQ